VNFLLGFGVVSRGEVSGIETGVGSGVGRGFPASRLFLYVVSTGSGKKRRFVAKSLFSVEAAFSFWTSSFLLLRVIVSTGSGANRRTFFTVVSRAIGEKRLEVGGGDVSDIVIVVGRGMEFVNKRKCLSLLNPYFVNNLTHSRSYGKKSCDQNTVCSVVACARCPSGKEVRQLLGFTDWR
jgi:hypothetical protein